LEKLNTPCTSFISAYIGLGSNLESPIDQIKLARMAINALFSVQELSFSRLYASEPMGPQDQPDYINAVMRVATTLPAIDLLHALQQIELAQGRVRNGQRWGARTLDLDLLLYSNQQIESEELCVPHRGIAERAFVLYPLSDCDPELEIPGHGRLSDLLMQCPFVGLRRLNDDESGG
jgi:2-amino-4-hydroxy-6-hydroxymethyldihydropteridine diphosphokinase